MADRRSFDEELAFIPASGLEEAAARLFALAGTRDPGTRGPKRSLEGLASSLGIKVDLAATNAVVGGQIAEVLDADWREGYDYVNLQVTVDGLNSLLEAASRRLWRTSRQREIGDESYEDVLRAFPSFRAALDKQEAVDRLSDLAGVSHDQLGPGGKEHRVTFESIANRFAPDLSNRIESKHALVAALCERFSIPWLSTAGSTGQSVTLHGLNLLLAGAERYANLSSSGWATPATEAADLLRVLRSGLTSRWDGRETVKQMRADESRNWRHMEWPGFYFEERARALLNAAYPTPPVGGPRRQYGSTSFDYASIDRVWDMKAHTVTEVSKPSGLRVSTAARAAILNDADAVTECLSEQGLGFLVVDGAATFDETGEFDEWHREFARAGRANIRYSSNSGRHRRRKDAFEPLIIRALWIENITALDAGIAGGWISREKQGSQAVREGQVAGAPRKDKFHLKVNRSAAWQVGQQTWE